jgi:hypothetical protein
MKNGLYMAVAVEFAEWAVQYFINIVSYVGIAVDSAAIYDRERFVSNEFGNPNSTIKSAILRVGHLHSTFTYFE